MDDFFDACEEGNLVKVRKFIKKGYNVKDTNEGFFRRTPLMYAVTEGRFDVVEYLIEHDADVCEGRFDVVKYLIVHDAHVSEKDSRKVNSTSLC